MTTEQVWLGIGLLGQAFFSTRFLVQWIASERAKKSIVPRHFWFFSAGGRMSRLPCAVPALEARLNMRGSRETGPGSTYLRPPTHGTGPAGPAPDDRI